MLIQTLTLEDFYELSQYRGLGNNMWYDHLEEILKAILKLLKQKYSETDFRVKFLRLLILRAETHEVDVDQEEALRALLHYETCENSRYELEEMQILCGDTSLDANQKTEV